MPCHSHHLSPSSLLTGAGMSESEVSNMRSLSRSVGQRSSLRLVCTLVPPHPHPLDPLSLQISPKDTSHLTLNAPLCPCRLLPLNPRDSGIEPLRGPPLLPKDRRPKRPAFHCLIAHSQRARLHPVSTTRSTCILPFLVCSIFL